MHVTSLSHKEDHMSMRPIFMWEKCYMQWLPIIPPQNQGLEFNSRILGWQQT